MSAKDHAVFANPGAVNADMFLIEAAAIAAHSGSSSIRNVDTAHAVFGKS